MKIKKSHVETIIFLVVYLFAVYMWTLPFQKNRTPYGEFDAISHWELADYIAETDKTFIDLPPFIDYSYGGQNSFRPHTLWYPPPFHTDLAIISSFAPERVVPVYLTNAVFATAILVSLFFVVRSLYGFLPAILSSFLLSFSMRDIMPYLWGQWPERFGYAFIPLILYCFYFYYTTYSKEDSKPHYLYIMGILLAVQMMVHPLSFFHSMVGLLVLGTFLFIKNRKIPLNFRHIGIALVLFIFLLSIFPYQTGNVIKSFMEKSSKKHDYPSVSRLFHWAPEPKDFVGSVPASYFSFSDMHGMWTLPFLLIGIAVLIIRRENRDLFLLAWLVSLYLILHRDFIEKYFFLHRSLSASAHIFVPITAIGILSIPSFLVFLKKYQNILKYIGAAVFVFLVLSYNAPAAYSILSSAYDSPIIRLVPAQMEASEWIKQNVPEDMNVSVMGPPWDGMGQMVYWISSYSLRISLPFEGFLTWKKYKDKPEIARYHLLNDYVMFDYSQIGMLQDRRFVDQWLAFEQQYMGNHTLLYNKNNIRVYKYEPS